MGMTTEERDLDWQDMRQSGQVAGQPLHCFDAVESTNTLALDMARQGAPPGTVLVADTQSGGRGRLGKAWASPPGSGLYCSIVLRPRLPPQGLAPITLAAGLAVAQAIEAVGGLRATIKWPNDVLLGGRKVAGILAECELSAAQPMVVLGIGINLVTTLAQFPVELRARAGSLLLVSGKVVGRGLMLRTLVLRLAQVVNRMEQGDFAGILTEWRARDATAGKWLTWLATDGRTVFGESLGPDQDGLLVIRDATGTYHHVLSGDIELDPSTLNGYFP